MVQLSTGGHAARSQRSGTEMGNMVGRCIGPRRLWFTDEIMIGLIRETIERHDRPTVVSSLTGSRGHCAGHSGLGELLEATGKTIDQRGSQWGVDDERWSHRISGALPCGNCGGKSITTSPRPQPADGQIAEKLRRIRLQTPCR